MTALGVYLHWPYCARICPYCDFNVVRDRGRGEEKPALRQAILSDLRAHARLTGPVPLTSIFLGGGTPSLMGPDDVAEIIATARGLWRAAPDLEVTLEANPTDVEANRFQAFAEAGVNRLSLGVQSLEDGDLVFLGRNHDSARARRAVGVAMTAFARVSLDLIYALPGQTVAAWSARLRAAIALGAEHISPYQLTIEPGTAFDRAVARGAFAPPPEGRSADLFDATQTILGSAGYEAYEVSNHARGAPARSRHNLLYWRGDDWIGVGPGAHGRLTIDGVRHATEAPRSIGRYIEIVRESGAGSALEALTKREAALERLAMGLRTVEGAGVDELASLDIPSPLPADLQPFVEARDGRLRVTALGRPVLDRIIAELAGV